LALTTKALGEHLARRPPARAIPDERERLLLRLASGWLGASSITAIDGVNPPIVEYHEHGGLSVFRY